MELPALLSGCLSLVRTQKPAIEHTVIAILGDRQSIGRNTMLDPVDECLERPCRLTSGPTCTVREARYLEVAEEILDIWRKADSTVVVLSGATGGNDTIGLKRGVNAITSGA